MATILVTGGAGYIGSVCAAQLLRQGHKVLIVDDLSTGSVGAVPDGAVFRELKIGDRVAMRTLLSEVQVDVVFHFAAKALIPESVANPGVFFSENVAAGIDFLEELRLANIRKFVFSSSAAVYGSPEKIPIDEDEAKKPVNSYGETKLMVERILEWYARAYGWGVAAFRYFNASGAWCGLGERHDPETHIIPLLFRVAAGQSSEFIVFGDDYPTPDGTCVRDYIHVVDIADAHIRAIESLESPGMTSFNIGTGKGYSVKEVIGVVESVTGCPVVWRVAGRRAGDPPVLCASPSRLIHNLGWKPQHSDLREIVHSAWEFHRTAYELACRP